MINYFFSERLEATQQKFFSGAKHARAIQKTSAKNNHFPIAKIANANVCIEFVRRHFEILHAQRRSEICSADFSKRTILYRKV
jgi:hypothetical protein